MSNISNLFETESERVVFTQAQEKLTLQERTELHDFFRGCHTATTTAKGVTGAAIAVWMAYASRKLQQRRIKVKPLYPMAAGVGIAIVVFQALTPTIYDNEKKRLAQIASPNVVEVVETLAPIIKDGSNAYQVSKFFENDSIISKDQN